MDEPETGLSPKTQLHFIRLMEELRPEGLAQFIIATQSPILMACPGSTIYSFDYVPVKEIGYEETEHYHIYKRFMEDRHKYFGRA